MLSIDAGRVRELKAVGLRASEIAKVLKIGRACRIAFWRRPHS